MTDKQKAALGLMIESVLVHSIKDVMMS